MYNNYGFVLNWEDLPEELREEKIDQWITFNYEAEGTEEAGLPLEKVLEDSENRKLAEQQISSRFPMYF